MGVDAKNGRKPNTLVFPIEGKDEKKKENTGILYFLKEISPTS